MGKKLLLSALVLFTLVSHAQTAIVHFGNGEVITTDDIDAFVAKRIDLRTIARSEWGMSQAVGQMAENRALALEGEARGIERGEGSSDDDRFDDRYAIKVAQEINLPCVKPDGDVAAKKYFEEHPDAFRLPTQIRLSRVILPVGASIDGGDPFHWLMAQAKAVASGATKIQDVAERASKTYDVDLQGDLGWVLIPEETQILKALATANAGDLVGPARDGDYVYLFHVEDKRPSRVLTWLEAAAQVPSRAMQFCREQTLLNMRKDMFAKYKVVIDEKALKAHNQINVSR